jgi:hypothetical protein
VRQRCTFRARIWRGFSASRAIQELAGHAGLPTTQRNVHLSPAATEDAIQDVGTCEALFNPFTDAALDSR